MLCRSTPVLLPPPRGELQPGERLCNAQIRRVSPSSRHFSPARISPPHATHAISRVYFSYGLCVPAPFNTKKTALSHEPYGGYFTT
ncbi:hypothetical protein Baya_12248 [Bagarius yarrelli]|uniref:Uncharacterized protein n=1 Tax=Bagarius yarrelli TaxID=175774 RepID=A0A556V4Z2_BAGYA|nr:hypothetical protein Baya_12248 [Bagarius yarrelli]